MEKIYWKVSRIGVYYIKAWLLFKNCILIVDVVYILLSDTKKQNKLTSYIKKEFTNYSKQNRYYILIGNFNSYMDKVLDYKDSSKLEKNSQILLHD